MIAQKRHRYRLFKTWTAPAVQLFAGNGERRLGTPRPRIALALCPAKPEHWPRLLWRRCACSP